MSKHVVRIVLSSVAAIVLIVILIIGLTGGLNMFKFNFNFKTVGAYTYPNAELYSKGNTEISAEGIQKLDIDWITDSVKIETYGGSMISVSESESEKLEEDEKLCYLVKDGVLHVRFWAPKTMQVKNFNKQKHLTVLIPESLAVLKKCTVETVSADINIKDIASEEFDLDSTSGEIRLNAKGEATRIQAESTSGNIVLNAKAVTIQCDSTSGAISFTGVCREIEFESTSGDIQCDASVKSADFDTTSGKINFKGKADSLNAESSSGDIAINAQINKVECDTNSGAVNFNGEANEIKCNTTSGDVSIQSGICPSKIDVDTTSGQIMLTIPGDKGFTAYYDTISGKFSCDFAVKTTDSKVVYGDGSAQFKLSSTSGDIKIKEK